MAGLNCEIKWETRLCEVNGELGYFHCWEHWSNVIDTSPLRGGHPGGQIGQVHGIIEFTDGVRRVDPSKIKFCDEENALLAEMAKHHQEGDALKFAFYRMMTLRPFKARSMLLSLTKGHRHQVSEHEPDARVYEWGSFGINHRGSCAHHL